MAVLRCCPPHHLLLLLLGASCLSLITGGSACNFGPGCLFPCRCAVGSCDPWSGRCFTGKCAATFPNSFRLNVGWGGHGCLTGNVAYNRPARQIASHNHMTRAGNAVDGVIATNISGGSCALPSGKKEKTGESQDRAAWWQVDLGQQHYISNITVFNQRFGVCRTCRYRLGRFYLFVTNSSEVPGTCPRNSSGYHLCHHVITPVLDASSETYPCDTAVVGRYVLLYKYGGLEVHYTQLCEFVAMGNRYIPCTHCRGTCTAQYGCVTCPAGKQPDTYCNTDCADGWYGANAVGCRRCGRCESGRTCDKHSGYCSSGCEVWWRGNRCTQYIDTVNFNSTDTVTLSDIRNSSVRVQWPSLVVRRAAYSFYGYKVECNGIDPASWRVVRNVAFQDFSTPPSTLIGSLSYNTRYEVVITPYKRWIRLGQTVNGSHIRQVFRTLCVDPHAPKNLHLTTSAQDGSPLEVIHASWELPTKTGCDNLAAVYVYIGSRSMTGSRLDGLVTHTVLRPGTTGEYTVTVYVCNNQQLCSQSARIRVNVNCADGRYGADCGQRCGNCTLGSICNKLSGACPSVCKVWWTGDWCGQYIDTANFTSADKVTFSEITSSQVRVEWPRVNVSPALTSSYGYRVECNGTDSALSPVPYSTLFKIIEQLEHNTYYDVRITPYKHQRDRQINGRTISGVFKTLCVAPQPPKAVNVTTFYQKNDTLKSINVTWQFPEESGCDHLTSLEVTAVDIIHGSTFSQSIPLDDPVTHTVLSPGAIGEYTVAIRVCNNQQLCSQIAAQRVPPKTDQLASPTTIGLVVGVILLAGAVITLIVCQVIRSKRAPPQATAVPVTATRDTAGDHELEDYGGMHEQGEERAQGPYQALDRESAIYEEIPDGTPAAGYEYYDTLASAPVKADSAKYLPTALVDGSSTSSAIYKN